MAVGAKNPGVFPLQILLQALPPEIRSEHIEMYCIALIRH
jgi:hypothetical protein